MLTTALCFFYLSMRQQQQLAPKPVAKPPAPNADPLLRAPGQADPLLDGVKDAAPAVAEISASERPAFDATAITIGDPSQGYKLQVTLTSRGGGVEQAELVERTKDGKYRFRALEHDGGYLGYLGLAETTTGLRIRTVPADSPASAAKGAAGALQVGDVLVELDGKSTSSRAGLEEILSHTKPGETAELSIERELDGTPQRLKASVVLSEAPLDPIRQFPGSSELVVGNILRPSLLTTLGSMGGTQIPMGEFALPALAETLDMDWETVPMDVDGGQGVEFRLPLDSFLAETGRPAQLDLVKRYRLYPASETNDGYLLDLETVVVNRNEKSVMVSLRQEGLSGLTLEGWWYSVKISPHMFAGAGQRDVIYDTAAVGHSIATTRSVVDRAKKTLADGQGVRPAGLPQGMPTVLLSESEPADARKLNYIGIDAPYFTAAILPHPQKDPEALTNLRGATAFSVAAPDKIDKAQLQATNTSFSFDTQESEILPGGELSRNYQVFIGPKDTAVLATHKLDLAIEYGWFPLIAKPLSAILHFFHAIVGNYGLAIVMLTVLVRGGMFPLGRKAAINAHKMQELQPELKRINELNKDNMEKRAKAMQDLYAKHNFKPLAGCLPMFIQLPIFIGLYRCLSVDISLRQAPLIPGASWASNLAGPDQLLNWSSWMPEFIAGRGTGWLGPYFNILPLVTVALFLLQQKMLMPKATDEQTRMTQNMMQIMTIFMGVLFFKVPSGLCIYFITSSAWSLVERKLVKRMMPPPSAPGQSSSSPPEAGSNSPKDGNNSGGPVRTNPKDRRKGQDSPQSKPIGRLQELKQMLDKPAVKSATQRGTKKERKRRG